MLFRVLAEPTRGHDVVVAEAAACDASTSEAVGHSGTLLVQKTASMAWDDTWRIADDAINGTPTEKPCLTLHCTALLFCMMSYDSRSALNKRSPQKGYALV